MYMTRALKREYKARGSLVCAVRVALLGFNKGHEWRTVWMTQGLKSLPMVRCIRCREVGWKA